MIVPTKQTSGAATQLRRDRLDNISRFATFDARAGNRRVVDVAQAVVDGHALLPARAQAPPARGTQD